MSLSICVPRRSDGGHRDRLWDWVRRRWEAYFRGAEIIEGHHDEDPDFNISLARNRAIQESTGDVLVIADADVVFDQLAVMSAVRRVQQDPRSWFYAFTNYYCATQEYTEELLSHPPHTMIGQRDIKFWDWGDNTESGCTVMSREAMYDVGGYDTEFRAWGPEDTAFRVAANLLVSPVQRIVGNVVHLWHEPQLEHWPDNPASVAAHQRWKRYEISADDPYGIRLLKGGFKC